MKTLVLEEQVKAFEVKEEAKAILHQAGLSIPDSPPLAEDECQLPPDITLIDFTELGRLHGAVVNMGCYIRSLAGMASIEKDIAEASYDFVKNKTMIDLSDVHEEKVTFTRAKVSGDEIVLVYAKKYYLAKARYELLSRKLENYDAMANAVSREITRRTNEMNQIGSVR